MILLIDNYDSFAHNLARYLRQLGQQVNVVRNDCLSLAEIADLSPAAIVMSPGPCGPDDAGICLQMVNRFSARIPMLGVCLGHQAICQALGGQIHRTSPVHGRPSVLTHSGHALFAGIESPFSAGRYHSLVVSNQSLPSSLQVICRSACGIVMGVAHRDYPVYGVQFHPESFMTPCGYHLLSNFLQLSGLEVDPIRVQHLSQQLLDQARPLSTRLADKWLSLTPHPYGSIS